MTEYMETKENRVFLHICCGPCSLMPVVHLRKEGFNVTAFFFNPNIHPEEEYGLRRDSAQLAAEKLDYPLVFAGDALKPAQWIRELNGVTQEGERCVSCYRQRLLPVALEAKGGDSISLRQAFCIPAISITKPSVRSRNKWPGKREYRFCIGISGLTGTRESICPRNWAFIAKNGAVAC